MDLKCANVRRIHKNVDPFDQNNYRLVSILPLLSKVYERVIYEQASNCFEPFLVTFCADIEKHLADSMLYLNY